MNEPSIRTFDRLGMPFPLFRAPVSHACIDKAGSCEVCGGTASIRFEGACYQCFRSADVDNVVDTELGMVRMEDAKNGVTHGIPLGDPSELPGYELVPHSADATFPDEQRFHVRVDSELLLELLRTPKYHTWQGECWQFCCPCVFLGSLPAGALSSDGGADLDAITAWFRSPRWDVSSSTMNIEDFDGRTEVTSAEALLGHLKAVRRGAYGAFILSRSRRVARFGDHATTKSSGESGSFFASVADSMLDAPEGFANEGATDRMASCVRFELAPERERRCDRPHDVAGECRRAVARQFVARHRAR